MVILSEAKDPSALWCIPRHNPTLPLTAAQASAYYEDTGEPEMLLDEDKATDSQKFQGQRCEVFGALTAEKIRAALTCRFSLLPHQALARLASSWYGASAQAMLNGDYSPISKWTQVQSQLAAEEGFKLEDVLELLRICRRSAIEGEKWSEDIFSVVDDCINEALVSIGREVKWAIPATLNYVSTPAKKAEPAGDAPTLQTPCGTPLLDQQGDPSDASSEDWSDDRRDFGRNRLRLPIRVRIAAGGSSEEVTHTQNVSRSGVYFVTRRKSYVSQMALKVTYPYWAERGAINREYRAKIVRMDRMADGSVGIAVEFTESLGARPKR